MTVLVPVWIFCKVVVVVESSACGKEIFFSVGTDKNDSENLPLRSRVDGEEADNDLWHDTTNRARVKKVARWNIILYRLLWYCYRRLCQSVNHFELMNVLGDCNKFMVSLSWW